MVYEMAGTVGDLRRRICELERQVEHLYSRLGVEPPEPVEPDVAAEVLELIRQGETVRAIQEHRRNTGCGLREAKEAVERAAGLA